MGTGVNCHSSQVGACLESVLVHLFILRQILIDLVSSSLTCPIETSHYQLWGCDYMLHNGFLIKTELL